MSNRFSALKPQQTIIDTEATKKENNIPNKKDLKPFFLPNYNPNCRNCYGRGHEGLDETHKLYVPCYKCRGKSSVTIDLRSGLISKG